jgi:YVTN family beta-propeller protein
MTSVVVQPCGRGAPTDQYNDTIAKPGRLCPCTVPEGLAAGPPRDGRTMIGLLGRGGIAREQEKARPGRARRATAVLGIAVLGMLAVPLAAAGITALPAAAATPYAVTATIGAGSYPTGVGVDPATDTIYVANEGSNSVSVIDGATNTVTTTIGVGTYPLGVGVDPATHTVYATNEVSGTVSVIDGATNTVTATIGVGLDPVGVGVDPSTHAVYVANSHSGSVSVITPPVSDADLSLATRASITTDATGPSGATVSYALPKVSDPDDTSVPAAACTPAPGSAFGIGTTTVHCSASDPDDTNSPVTVSFTVTVKGAAAQLGDLYQAVKGVKQGTSLSQKVAQARSYLASGDVVHTCSALGAFLRTVAARSGRSIPAATASTLIADAQRIQAVLTC